jgi:2-polyprenyl-6-hydroxyphenyl methylase / 3-demethylubiquinone-9 3-methyltransferase
MEPGRQSSVVAEEVARFDALAGRWWDPDGPLRPLHRMNPTRVAWIVKRIRERFGDAGGQRVLDVGCGAGLAAEALAKTGFSVQGIDAAADLIAAAVAHATGQRLDLAYRVAAPEDLLAEAERFDVITALEVIEHVADPDDFLRTLRRLVRPGGVLVLSTLDRSVASLLTAKIGAEYVLRWLPRGTHDWRKFIRPAELAAALRRAGWRPSRIEGMAFDPLSATWRIVPRPGVNYIVAADG